MTIDITTELLGSSGSSLKFEAEGDIVKIRISRIEKSQETSYDDGTPVFWPSGDPKYQYVVSGISNGEEARLFVKGYMIDAFKEALRKAGVQPGQPLDGGTLSMKWDSTEEPRKPGMKGARKYVAKFEPAPTAVVDEDLF